MNIRNVWITAIAFIAAAGSGCSSSDVPKMMNENDSTEFKLVAEVITGDPTKIQINYSLTNNSTEDRVVFDVGGPLRSTIIDGEVRLFKGQYDPEISSVVPLRITGQILKAGETLSEMAERELPFVEDFRDVGGQPTYNPTEFEFCIGHSDPSDQRLVSEGLPDYFLRQFTERSRNECVMLVNQ